MAEPIKILNSLGEELVSFEPTDIFYEVVGTYAVAACGLMFYRPSTVEILKGIPQSMATMESSKEGDIGFDVGDIISHVRGGAQTRDHSIYNTALASTLAISASLTLKEQLGETKWLRLRESSPSAEYLRHLRNACAHGGRWHFERAEPRRLAEWRGNTLSKEMHRSPVWDLQFTRGDLLVLLWDVEQTVKVSSRFPGGRLRMTWQEAN